MCEHGDTVQVLVRIDPSLSHSGEVERKLKPIDRCIAPIVRALELSQVHMLGSCCGHGKTDGEILLVDGRHLVVKDGPYDAPTESDSDVPT